MLLANNLSFDRNGNMLFNNLDISISSNKILHISGRNGIGKTTLIKILANLLIPKTGEIFKNPALARTLEILSEKGLDQFYTGNIARITADFIQEQGGFLSYEDLASFQPEWVEPISTNYRG